MTLLDPRFWLAALVALLLAFAGGEYHGRQAATVEADLKEVKLDNSALTGELKTNTALSSDADKIDHDANKEKQDAQAQTDVGSGAIRTRTVRLYLPATTCTPAPPGPTGAGAATATAELLPETADRIYKIGRDADDAVRDLNRCIARYDAARDRLNRDASQPRPVDSE